MEEFRRNMSSADEAIVKSTEGLKVQYIEKEMERLYYALEAIRDGLNKHTSRRVLRESLLALRNGVHEILLHGIYVLDARPLLINEVQITIFEGDCLRLLQSWNYLARVLRV